MRKEILDALKAKFPGVSEAILSRIADKLSKTATTAEQVKAAVDAFTWQQVIEGYGDSRATEAQQTAVHNYEAKYGLKDGQKIDGGTGTGGQAGGGATVVPPPPAGGAEQVPAWAQAIIDSNKTLTDRLNKMDGERTTATRRQQLSTIVSKLPEKLRKPYERMAIDSLTDEQFNALVGEVTTEVNDLANDINSKGAVFSTPTANNQGGNNGELTKEQIDAINHREGVVKDNQQPF